MNSPIVSDVGRFGTKSSELILMKLSWMLMPSCVSSVHDGRPPLIAVFVRRRGWAPADNWTSASGSAVQRQVGRICCCSTGVVTSGDVVGTSDVPASTVTFSLTLPSSRRAVSEYS